MNASLEALRGRYYSTIPWWLVLVYGCAWVASVRCRKKDRQKTQLEVFFLILLTLKLVQQKPTHICHKKLASENHLRKNRKTNSRFFFHVAASDALFCFGTPPKKSPRTTTTLPGQKPVLELFVNNAAAWMNGVEDGGATSTCLAKGVGFWLWTTPPIGFPW